MRLGRDFVVSLCENMALHLHTANAIAFLFPAATAAAAVSLPPTCWIMKLAQSSVSIMCCLLLIVGFDAAACGTGWICCMHSLAYRAYPPVHLTAQAPPGWCLYNPVCLLHLCAYRYKSPHTNRCPAAVPDHRQWQRGCSAQHRHHWSRQRGINHRGCGGCGQVSMLG